MTNKLTTQPGKADKEDETAADLALSQYLRADNIVRAINANMPEGLPTLAPIPKGYVFRKRDREAVSIAMHAAFELTGGVPGLVQWAAGNPDKFYPLWSTLQKSDTETGAGGMVIQFNSQIPQNALDDVTVDETGRVLTINQSAKDLPE